MSDRRSVLVAAGGLLVGAAGLPGCGGGPAYEPVPFTDVTMTLFRPFAAGEYVWRSAAELDAALRAAPFKPFPIGLVLAEPVVPAWDFQASMVVGLSLGEGSWCTAPRMRQVLSNGSELIVDYDVMAFGTLACSRLAPRIGFVQVPRVPGRVELRRHDL